MTVPNGYAPLGAIPALNKTAELLLFGIGRETTLQQHPLVLLELTGQTGQAVNEVLHAVNAPAMPWATETRNMQSLPSTLRMPSAGDFDGDGRDELATTYWSGGNLNVHLVQDLTDGFATTTAVLQPLANVTNVAAIAADLDGDGDDELVTGVTASGHGTLQVWRWTGAQFVAAISPKVYSQTLLNAATVLSFAKGNLDRDRSQELAVTISETRQSDGAARFAVYDDLYTDLATLREGRFEGLDQQNQLRAGVGATVAIGDVDGDTLGEVVIAGLTAFGTYCSADEHFVMVLDDAVAGLAPRSSHWFAHFHGGCGSGSNPNVRNVNVFTPDLDGDRIAEIVVNQFVFDDLRDPNLAGPNVARGWVRPNAWQLPGEVVWEQGFGWYDRSTATMTVGDFTGDGRDDVAVYRQNRARVEVFALAQTGNTLARVRNIPVPDRNEQSPCNPVLVAANVDLDSPVLHYSEAEYQLVYSEPIVLAALAAPPTGADIGQNVGASFTAFGNTNTTVQERERSVTFSAGVSVGMDVNVLGAFGLQMKATMTAAATASLGTAYELAKTIVFTTAPTEDTVVFTCVPIDRYTYTVVSHPDPAAIGSKVVVDLPRSPITLQAERGFYNRSVQPGDLQIGANVFTHTVGDPRSYPTTSEKNARLLAGGLQIGPQSVGQGGGSTEVTLSVGREIASGGALAMSYSVELEATAGGVLAGVSVGVEQSDTWRIASGQSTTYTGVVGAIDAANFAANRYLFGLFTYVHHDAVTGQKFQVLNYWVE